MVTRATGVTVLAALMMLPACQPAVPSDGPEGATAANEAGGLTDADDLYVSGGDSYEPGPLVVDTFDVADGVHGAPVALRIHKPQQAGRYAVVVFQHGFLLRNEWYDHVLRQVASHGFIVVAPQTYEPGLGPLVGCPTHAAEARVAAEVLHWLRGHLDAVCGGSIPADRLGLAGHSRGGKVAWLVVKQGLAEVDALAGVDPTDGTGGPWSDEPRVIDGRLPFSLPALIIGAGMGGVCSPVGDNHERFYEASRPPAWHVVAVDQGHADMLDEECEAVFFATVICPGGPDRPNMRRLTGGLLTAFFRGTLQGDGDALDVLSDRAAAPVDIRVESKWMW